MNCRQTQRWLHVAPFTDVADVRAHLAECDACRRVAAELAQLDRKICEVAMQPPVPEGLSARVLLRQQLFLSQRVKRALAILLPGLRACLGRNADFRR